MPFVDLPLLSLIALGLAAALTVAGAISDARRFRLPNGTSLGIIALFPLFALANPSLAWGGNLAVAGGVLVGGFILYALNIAGAGDAKLLAALSLWAGTEHIGLFLFVTAIAGGLLSLAILARHQARVWKHGKKSGDPDPTPLTKIQIPYGIAIATGGLCLFVTLSHSTFPSG